MNKPLFLVILYLLQLNFFISPMLVGQEKKDPEAEYLRIRTMAFEGKLDSAAIAGRILVNSNPSYGDARILLARILAWKKDYANAAAVVDTLLISEPQNPDALSLKRDIVQWSKDNRTESTGLRAGYLFDTFQDPYKRFWQVFNAGVEHKFNWGLLVGGVNIGNANIGEIRSATDSLISKADHSTEWQLSAEAFPKFSDKNYAYLAYAYSPGSYFPTHRAAVEIWQVLPAGWGVSAGMNYYYFNRNIYIALASVEKYVGRYWLSLKGYLYFKEHGVTTSGYFTMRRYFSDINYFQVTLGAGTAPDEPYNINVDLERYSAYSLRLAYNVALAKRLVMRIGTGYSYEEYRENTWRNRFEGNVDFVYAIKMK
jgi:YaiO family outer membrane protein